MKTKLCGLSSKLSLAAVATAGMIVFSSLAFAETVPYGYTNLFFSLAVPPYPGDYLQVVPYINYNPNGCPGPASPCSAVAISTATVVFLDQNNNGLGGGFGGITIYCNPSDCHQDFFTPLSIFALIPLDTKFVMIQMEVQLGGAWTFESAGFVLPSDGLVGPTPLPAALPLFATGLGALGLLGWRRKRKAQAA